MSLICIDPVPNTKDTYCSTIFRDDGDFYLSRFEKSVPTEKENITYFCYDAFRVLDLFPQISFVWDVRVLYELLGYKCESLLELARQILQYAEIERYVRLLERLTAYFNSYKEANIDINQHTPQELLPECFFNNLYLEKANITKLLFLKIEEKDREFYHNFFSYVKLLHKISNNYLNVDVSKLDKKADHNSLTIKKFVRNNKAKLIFNPVGAKTGRLGFERQSINVYNLPKKLRHCIVADKGHKIVEFDFKSFQPRIAIFSVQDKQFKDQFRDIVDIYSVFPGDRKKKKIEFLAWMYSKYKSPHETFDSKMAPVWELREDLVKKCKKDGFLKTMSGRRVYGEKELDHIIFQHFITATEVDCVLSLMKKLDEQKIKVLFPYHDSVVCQLSNDDLSLIPKIKEICENHLYSLFDAKFPVSVSMGNDYGNMNEYTLEKF